MWKTLDEILEEVATRLLDKKVVVAKGIGLISAQDLYEWENSAAGVDTYGGEY